MMPSSTSSLLLSSPSRTYKCILRCITDNVIHCHSSIAKSTYTERAQRTSRSSNPTSRNRETQYHKTVKVQPSHHPPRDHTALKPQVRTQPSRKLKPRNRYAHNPSSRIHTPRHLAPANPETKTTTRRKGGPRRFVVSCFWSLDRETRSTNLESSRCLRETIRGFVLLVSRPRNTKPNPRILEMPATHDSAFRGLGFPVAKPDTKNLELSRCLPQTIRHSCFWFLGGECGKQNDKSGNAPQKAIHGFVLLVSGPRIPKPKPRTLKSTPADDSWFCASALWIANPETETWNRLWPCS